MNKFKQTQNKMKRYKILYRKFAGIRIVNLLGSVVKIVEKILENVIL